MPEEEITVSCKVAVNIKERYSSGNLYIIVNGPNSSEKWQSANSMDFNLNPTEWKNVYLSFIIKDPKISVFFFENNSKYPMFIDDMSMLITKYHK